MAVPLYFDVHVDYAIAGQLRLRQVDIITAQEDGASRLSDEQLLDRAAVLRRPLFTHDIRLHAMVLDLQSRKRSFFGLIFAHLNQVSIGQCVRELEIIAKATSLDDRQSSVLRLPL
jgi:hypothetical protein